MHHVDTADVGQHEVEQEYIRLEQVDLAQGGRAIFGLAYLIAVAFEVAAQGVTDLRLVLDHQHARAGLDLAHAVASIGAGKGNVTLNFVPAGELSTRTLPPLSSTKPLTMVNPRPLP